MQYKTSKPCLVGIHWISLAEYPQMSTHLAGFPSFFMFLLHFLLAKSTTISIRVKCSISNMPNEFPPLSAIVENNGVFSECVLWLQGRLRQSITAVSVMKLVISSTAILLAALRSLSPQVVSEVHGLTLWSWHMTSGPVTLLTSIDREFGINHIFTKYLKLSCRSTILLQIFCDMVKSDFSVIIPK